jgi:hypothetical protein
LIAVVTEAAAAVQQKLPGGDPLYVGDISARAAARSPAIARTEPAATSTCSITSRRRAARRSRARVS